MKKIVLWSLLLIGAWLTPKTSKAQYQMLPINGGNADSIHIIFQCLDSAGLPIACDSGSFDVQRWNTSTGAFTSVTSNSAFTNPRLLGHLTYTLTTGVATLSNITAAGLYSVYGWAVGKQGTANLKTPFLYYVNVGAVDSIEYFANANVHRYAGATVATPATAGIPDVNTKNWNGTVVATPATAGVPDINTKNWNGTVVATPATAGIPDINVKNWVNQAVPTPITGATGNPIVTLAAQERDSLFRLQHDNNNFILNGSFEMGTRHWGLAGTTNPRTIAPGWTNQAVADGQYVLSCVGGASAPIATCSDTIMLAANEAITYGGKIRSWIRTASKVAYIGLCDSAGTLLDSISVRTTDSVPTFRSRTLRCGQAGNVGAGNVSSKKYYIKLTHNSTATTDSATFDGIFAMPGKASALLIDTTAALTAGATVSDANIAAIADTVARRMQSSAGLLLNGSFENGTRRWTLAGTATPASKASNDANEIVDGKYMLSMAGGATAASAISDTFKLAVGDRISYGGFEKYVDVATTGTSMGIQLRTTAGTIVDSISIAKALAGQWYGRSRSLMVGQAGNNSSQNLVAGDYVIRCIFNSTSGSDSGYFDKLFVTPVVGTLKNDTTLFVTSNTAPTIGQIMDSVLGRWTPLNNLVNNPSFEMSSTSTPRWYLNGTGASVTVYTPTSGALHGRRYITLYSGGGNNANLRSDTINVQSSSMKYVFGGLMRNGSANSKILLIRVDDSSTVGTIQAAGHSINDPGWSWYWNTATIATTGDIYVKLQAPTGDSTSFDGIFCMPVPASGAIAASDSTTIADAVWKSLYAGRSSTAGTFGYAARNADGSVGWGQTGASSYNLQTLLDSMFATLPKGNNLIANPSFEQGTLHWRVSAGSGAILRSITNDSARDGRKYLRLKAGPDSIARCYSDTFDMPGFHARYLIGAYIRSGGTAHIQIRDQNDVLQASSDVTQTGSAAGSWSAVVQEYKSETGTGASLVLQVNANDSADYDMAYVMMSGSNAIDSGNISRALKRAYGFATNGTDTLTLAQRTVTAKLDSTERRRIDYDNRILKNPSFEYDDSVATPTGWGVTLGGTAKVNTPPASATIYAPSGSRVARITQTSAAASSAVLKSDTLLLGVGHRVYFGAWVYTHATASSAPTVELWQATTPRVSISTGAIPNQSWTFVDTIFRVSTAGRYTLRISGSGAATTDTTMFDGVQLFAMIDSVGGGGGTADWTSGERNEIRGALGISGGSPILPAGGTAALRDSIHVDNVNILTRMAKVDTSVIRGNIVDQKITVTAGGVVDSVAKAPRTMTSVATVTNDVNVNSLDSIKAMTTAGHIILGKNASGTLGDSVIIGAQKIMQSATAFLVANISSTGNVTIDTAALRGNIVSQKITVNNNGIIDSVQKAGIAAAMPSVGKAAGDSVWLTNFVNKATGSSGAMIIDSAKKWGQTAAGSSSITATDAKNIADSVANRFQNPGNLVHNPGFERSDTGALPIDGWKEYVGADDSRTGRGGGGSSVKLLTGGRFALRLRGAVSGVASDTIMVPGGTNIVFGGNIFSSSTTIDAIRFATGGGTPLSAASRPPAKDKLIAISGSHRVTGSGPYTIQLGSAGMGAGDSLWLDDIYLYAYPDTIGVTLSASGGGSSIGSLYTDTIYCRNTTTASNVPLVQVLVKNLSGTSLGTLVTNANGKVVATFDTSVYLLYPMFTSGISWTDNPDSFHVTGSGQNDTIRGTTFNPGTPAAASQCRVYGWLHDIIGNAPPGGVEISISYINRGGNIRCCVGDSSYIQVGYAQSTKADDAGYWYLDLYPSTKLIPATDYLIKIHSGAVEYLSQRFTVPVAASWHFNY